MALSDINVNIQEQTIQLDDNELKLKCPFKLMISGSSGAGKSRWSHFLKIPAGVNHTVTASPWRNHLGDHGLPQALEFTMITRVVPPRL